VTNRRRSERIPKRVEVQFWQVGQKAQRGYSTNISATGMHIATPTPLPPFSRLRIEVLHEQRGFLIEAEVAHRRAAHPELVKVLPPGMGVRFLSPGELIRELFPGKPEPAAGGARPDTGSRPAGANDQNVSAGGLRTFSVRFASARDFLAIYARDIVNGGLFVATSRPGKLSEIVTIEIHLPGPAPLPVPLAARVVQRFEPAPGTSAVMAGMGVELLDLPAVLERLKPIADRLASLTG
jgi:Tfp pilus assembly protein PilZ